MADILYLYFIQNFRLFFLYWNCSIFSLSECQINIYAICNLKYVYNTVE
jgi:hypothetical protein